MEFFKTNISEAAIKEVNTILSTSYVSAGKMADLFEKELIKQAGFVNPVTLNSGTSALHLALVLANVGPGDEVIIPAQTFIATGLVVLMQGGIPVFADIQAETGNIDPESIKNKITGRTKAIIPVHWSGYPCDMDEIGEVANEYGLTVVEDAAHAFGAEYKGKAIGSISRFTAFSFQAIKHLTTGDGGALCCKDDTDFYQAKRRRWFDIDRENTIPSVLGERDYNALNIGYKYHMNDIAASIGIGNLVNVKSILDHHRKIAAIYTEGLGKTDGIKLMNYKLDRISSWWFFQILVENRIGFIKRLKGYGIPASVVHLRIDRNSIFGGERKELFNQGVFNETQVSLPVHKGINAEDAEHIVEVIKQGW